MTIFDTIQKRYESRNTSSILPRIALLAQIVFDLVSKHEFPNTNLEVNVGRQILIRMCAAHQITNIL